MINRRNLVGAAALGLAGAAATFANPKSGEALSGPAISRSRRHGHDASQHKPNESPHHVHIRPS